MKLRSLLPLALAALTTSAFAAPFDLGLAGQYNAYALGNFNSSGSDTEGAVAVAGNANLSSYSVNALHQAGNHGVSLAVGGNLAFNGGAINQGDAWVAGSKSVSNLGFSGQYRSSAPFSFASINQSLLQLSSDLAGVAANGSAVFDPWGGVNFTGDGSAATQVFHVSGSALLNVNNIQFSHLQAGQTLILDISGSSAGWRNVGLSGFANYNVLFNFSDATDLTLTGVGVYGSILAPKATVNGGSGQVNGNVIVQNWYSNIQINDNHLFAGADLALPDHSNAQVDEPGMLALLVLGLVAGVGRKTWKGQALA